MIDPYSEWLGLPPGGNTPNHYVLLGLDPRNASQFDTEAVHRAALNQSKRIRRYQSGPHSELSQKVLNEIARAEIVLADAGRRAEYDREIGLAGKEGGGGSPWLWVASAASLLVAVGLGYWVLTQLTSGGTGARDGGQELATPQGWREHERTLRGELAVDPASAVLELPTYGTTKELVDAYEARVETLRQKLEPQLAALEAAIPEVAQAYAEEDVRAAEVAYTARFAVLRDRWQTLRESSSIEHEKQLIQELTRVATAEEGDLSQQKPWFPTGDEIERARLLANQAKEPLRANARLALLRTGDAEASRYVVNDLAKPAEVSAGLMNALVAGQIADAGPALAQRLSGDPDAIRRLGPSRVLALVEAGPLSAWRGVLPLLVAAVADPQAGDPKLLPQVWRLRCRLGGGETLTDLQQAYASGKLTPQQTLECIFDTNWSDAYGLASQVLAEHPEVSLATVRADRLDAAAKQEPSLASALLARRLDRGNFAERLGVFRSYVAGDVDLEEDRLVATAKATSPTDNTRLFDFLLGDGSGRALDLAERLVAASVPLDGAGLHLDEVDDAALERAGLRDFLYGLADSGAPTQQQWLLERLIDDDLRNAVRTLAGGQARLEESFGTMATLFDRRNIKQARDGNVISIPGTDYPKLKNYSPLDELKDQRKQLLATTSAFRRMNGEAKQYAVLERLDDLLDSYNLYASAWKDMYDSFDDTRKRGTALAGYAVFIYNSKLEGEVERAKARATEAEKQIQQIDSELGLD